MLFRPLNFEGVYLIELDEINDDRGFFARYFCQNEFKSNNLNYRWVQMNNTMTINKGSIRGLHFQKKPFEEVKLIRCIKGAIFDVIIDLRKDKKTYGKWLGVELNEFNRHMLYIPKGFAHGFQTLQDNTELLYMHSNFYNKESESGINYNDFDININWPLPISNISSKDKNLLSLKEI